MTTDPRDAYIATLEEKIDQLKREHHQLLHNAFKAQATWSDEVAHIRSETALIVYALDCAIQLIEALIMYLPDGMPLSDGVATAKSTLDRAMSAITGKRPKSGDA